MPRTKTGACTSCGEAMWTGTGSTIPDRMVCRPCRRLRATQAEQARQMALRFACCSDCDEIFERHPSSSATRCEDCRLPLCTVCGTRVSHTNNTTCSRRCRTIAAGHVVGGDLKKWRPVPVWAVRFPTCRYCGNLYAAHTAAQLHRSERCRLANQRAATARFVKRWTEATGLTTASGIRQAELTYEDRLLSRYVVRDNGCWQWIGTFNTAGYGQIGRDGTTVPAHRAMWEQLRGPVPVSLELDHDCHNADLTCAGGPTCLHRGCVNPEHLSPVTKLQNHPSRRLDKGTPVKYPATPWGIDPGAPPLSPRYRAEMSEPGAAEPLGHR